MEKDDAPYLRHILDAIRCIEEYITGVNEEDFLQNRLLQDGVVRQLEIIGEASRRLTPSIRAQWPSVQWGEILGMRNRLVHAYFDVNLEVCWEVATLDLPKPKPAVSDMLKVTEKGDNR